jgi:hypothetical protein
MQLINLTVPQAFGYQIRRFEYTWASQTGNSDLLERLGGYSSMPGAVGA